MSKTDDLDDLGAKTDLSIYDNDLVCHITQAMFYKYWYLQGKKWVNMTTCYGNEEKMENMAETEKKTRSEEVYPFHKTQSIERCNKSLLSKYLKHVII